VAQQNTGPDVDAMQLNAYPEQKWWYEVEKTLGCKYMHIYSEFAKMTRHLPKPSPRTIISNELLIFSINFENIMFSSEKAQTSGRQGIIISSPAIY
jgi:hypothetical protein